MIRTPSALALVLAFAASAWAQRIHHRPVGPPQPAGVILPPAIPFVGSGATPSPVPPVRSLPFRHRFVPGPYYFDPWAFAPGYWPWPDIYDVESGFPVTQPAPQFAPSPVFVTPAPKIVLRDTAPPSPRARLTLDVPTGAQVWLGGDPVSTRATPIVLESPDLEPGQRYNFDLRVTWSEPTGVQERKRTLSVAAGQSTSLTYTAAGGAPGR